MLCHCKFCNKSFRPTNIRHHNATKSHLKNKQLVLGILHHFRDNLENLQELINKYQEIRQEQQALDAVENEK